MNILPFKLTYYKYPHFLITHFCFLGDIPLEAVKFWLKNDNFAVIYSKFLYCIQFELYD